MRTATKSINQLVSLPSRASEVHPDQLPAGRPTGMKRFLLNCAGINIEIMSRKECATEETKYVAIGALFAVVPFAETNS